MCCPGFSQAPCSYPSSLFLLLASLNLFWASFYQQIANRQCHEIYIQWGTEGIPEGSAKWEKTSLGCKRFQSGRKTQAEQSAFSMMENVSVLVRPWPHRGSNGMALKAAWWGRTETGRTVTRRNGECRQSMPHFPPLPRAWCRDQEVVVAEFTLNWTPVILLSLRASVTCNLGDNTSFTIQFRKVTEILEELFSGALWEIYLWLSLIFPIVFSFLSFINWKEKPCCQ